MTEQAHNMTIYENIALLLPHTIPHNRKELYTINHVKYNQNLQLCLSSPPTIKSRELHAARCTNTCIEHKIAIKMLRHGREKTTLSIEARATMKLQNNANYTSETCLRKYVH
jgi:hypothetical protein